MRNTGKLENLFEFGFFRDLPLRSEKSDETGKPDPFFCHLSKKLWQNLNCRSVDNSHQLPLPKMHLLIHYNYKMTSFCSYLLLTKLKKPKFVVPIFPLARFTITSTDLEIKQSHIMINESHFAVDTIARSTLDCLRCGDRSKKIPHVIAFY